MTQLQLRNICKTYTGSEKKANNNISLDLKKGEILCIAGENGAGKTTLIKILCGLEKPDMGAIYIDGKLEKINSVFDAKKLNIGMVHQHFMLFSEYTAAENIVMGIEPKKYGIFFDKKKAVNIADKIISDNNFSIKSNSKIKELSLGERQQVEICRVLYNNAQVIILDEPTSILTEKETLSLFKTLKNLAGSGKSIIIITHKLREIKQIADRVAVFRGGELAGVCNVHDVNEYEIARMMIGDENPQYEKKTGGERGYIDKEPIIVFDSVTVKKHGQKRPLLDNVSFSVKSGEILGFAGVGGNGLGVIEAVLGGFLHPVSGKIFYKGKDITHLNTRALRKQGLSYVPADRINVGSALNATIKENMIINNRKELSKIFRESSCGSRLNYSSLLAEKYKIKIPDIREKAFTLSGGNLQKLILAREIDCLKDYIVFSEPTWGLDIMSSRFIMEEMDCLRKKGAAIILISANLDEILALSDRIVVMFAGKAAGIFDNTGESVKEAVGNYMQGLFADNKERG